MEINNIGAVILAAGKSTRQKGFKPLLPIGDKKVLEHCLHLFKNKGLWDIVVVLGHRADELRPIVHALDVKAVFNPDFEQGMFSSVQAGVAALRPSTQAFFLLPVDIPLVRSLSLDCLLQELTKNYEADALIPAFKNKTGHPPLICESLRPRIAEHDGSQGLREVLDKALTINVEVPDQHILIDIDTPEQYQKALRLYENYNLPAFEEAEILLSWECREKPEVIAHCQKVSQVAKKIATALNMASPGLLNIDLVMAGALLHDIAKGQAKHANAGSKRIIELGFAHDLADIVAKHADYDPDPGSNVNEVEVVYLADKLVKGDRIIGLDKRFEDKYKLYKDNQEALQSVQRRWEQARKIYERIDLAIGANSVSPLSIKERLLTS